MHTEAATVSASSRVPSIAATLDLADDMQRRLTETIQHMHTGRHSLINRMHDIRRDGSTLVELAKWRRGGFTVLRWSWTATTITLTWDDCPSLQSARTCFAKCP
jgi:hypothetical protein